MGENIGDTRARDRGLVVVIEIMVVEKGEVASLRAESSLVETSGTGH